MKLIFGEFHKNQSKEGRTFVMGVN